MTTIQIVSSFFISVIFVWGAMHELRRYFKKQIIEVDSRSDDQFYAELLWPGRVITEEMLKAAQRDIFSGELGGTETFRRARLGLSLIDVKCERCCDLGILFSTLQVNGKTIPYKYACPSNCRAGKAWASRLTRTHTHAKSN